MAHTYETLRAAVLAAYIAFKDLARMTIIAACATGKTRQGIAIHEASGSQLTVIFEPTLSLISQTLAEWKEHSSAQFDVLIVCSDSSVTEDDEVIVSLDNSEIAAWLKKPSDIPKVLFTTYQSSYRLADIYKEFLETPAFNLGLLDEAHLTSINSEDSLFATALREDIKITQRVFFTATPKVFSEDGSTNSMDNEEVFGKTIFTYTNKQAVADGLIKDFQIVIATVSDTQIADLIDAKKVVGGGLGNVSANSAAVQIAVSKAIKEFGLNRIIGFFSTVTGAKQAASDFNILSGDLGVPHMVSASVDGQMPTSEVTQEIEELKLGNRILHSCKVIGVGTNVPAVDGLLFSDPKSSLIEIIQNIGRGQRKTHPEDNAPLVVVLPLVVTDKLVIGGFKKLIRILNSIRDEDELVSISKGQTRSVAPITGRGMGVIRFLHCDASLDDSFIKSIELKIINEKKPLGYWVLETCMADALDYQSRSDWYGQSTSAYAAAHKHGWLEECCAHMITERKPKGYWTLETCMADAYKHPTLKDWSTKSSTAYKHACTNGWLAECSNHFPDKKIRKEWTPEILKESASGFDNQKAWKAGDPKAYAAAWSLDIMGECTGHMTPLKKPNGYWNNLENCKADALNYTNRDAWNKSSHTACWSAQKNGWMEECSAHFIPSPFKPNDYWDSLERCKEEALKYPTKTLFWKNAPGAFAAARKNGWAEECCGHMIKRNNKQPKE